MTPETVCLVVKPWELEGLYEYKFEYEYDFLALELVMWWQIFSNSHSKQEYGHKIWPTAILLTPV